MTLEDAIPRLHIILVGEEITDDLLIKDVLLTSPRSTVESACIRFARRQIAEERPKTFGGRIFPERDIVDLVENLMEEYARLLASWWKPTAAAIRPDGADNIEEIPDVLRLVTFLRSARERGLSKPSARFLAPDLKDLRLSLAGPRSAYPEGMEVRHNSRLIGTILPNGFVIGVLARERAILNTLIAIGESPAEAAKIYSDLTNQCSFCNQPLSAEARLVGYGPICAVSYGLSYDVPVSDNSRP